MTTLIGASDSRAGDRQPDGSAAGDGGSRIPGFRIIETLGEGGFGIVHAAEQERPVRRRVAVKILKHGSAGSDALARFEAERQALALMDHPGIARVFDAGETTDGLPYFVMEWIDGPPITVFCRKEGLDLRARIELVIAVCRAVGHAHRQGIIHRDIKPSNVLVQHGDGGPVAKVIDFGIAKATDSLLTDRTLLTRENQVVGTPSYMSPEQAARRDSVDTRTDIYSLGVLLYELVTGTPPFRDEDLAGMPWDEALRRIRTESPPRPSARIRELSAGGGGREFGPIPPDLDWIVMRTLEKEAGRRYETADALARDLERCLAGEAVEARPPSVAYRAGKFVRRHRLPVAAVGAVAAALVVGASVSFVMFLRSERSAAEARVHAQRARESEALGRERFSRADFQQASPLMDDRPAVAVAHLARALRTDPGNRAAATRLLVTLASRNWARRLFLPHDHGAIVRALAFTPDGERLVIGGDAGNLDIIDASSGEMRSRLPVGDSVFSVDAAPDGREIAVFVSWDGLIVIDPDSGERVGRIDGVRSRGGNASFSDDGMRLAAAFDDGTVQVWNRRTRSIERTLEGMGEGCRVAFVPGGTALAIGAGRLIRFLDAVTGETLGGSIEHSGTLRRFLLSPDGRLVVTGGIDGLIRIWDRESAALLHERRHGAELVSMAISPDGSRLVTGGRDGLARRWRLDTGEPEGPPLRHDGPIARIVVSPDGTLVACGVDIQRPGDAAVTIWDARTGAAVSTPIHHPRGAGSLVFHPDGRRLAVSSRSRLTAVWRLEQAAARPLALRHPKPVWRVSFDRAQGRERLLTLAADGEARAWDVSTGFPLGDGPVDVGEVAVAAHAAGAARTLRNGYSQGRPARWPHATMQSFVDGVAPRFREGGVVSAAATDDGTLLATGCEDGRVRIWSIEDGGLLQVLEGSDVPVGAVAFTPDSAHLAAGDGEGFVRIWRLADGEAIVSVDAHGGAVIAIAFSPDGRLVASGSTDRFARLLEWQDPPEGAAAGPSLPHDGRVAQLAFHPGGSILATSGEDNAARLWSVPAGRPIAPPLRHIDIASEHGLFLDWTSRGDRLVTSGSHDNAARCWDPGSGRLLSQPMILLSGILSAAIRPGDDALVTGGDFDFQARLWDLDSGEALTRALAHDQRVIACAFDAAGTRLATASLAGTVHLRDLPPPSVSVPASFLGFAEALVGFRFNANGVLEECPPTSESGSDAIATPDPPAGQSGDGGNPAADAWFRWLMTVVEPSRPVSPLSAVTIRDHLDHLERNGSAEALGEAHLLAPGERRITAALARSLMEGPDPRLGEFLLGRSLRDAPDDVELLLAAGRAWIGRGREGLGLRELARSAVRSPHDPRGWHEIGVLLAGADDWFDAGIALREAVQAAAAAGNSEAQADAEARLGALRNRVPLHFAGRWDAIVSESTGESGATSGQEAATFRRVLASLAGSDPWSAVQLAAESVEASPDDPLLWSRLAEVALAVADLSMDGGDAEARGSDLESAGFGALWCGETSRARLQKVTERIARRDPHSTVDADGQGLGSEVIGPAPSPEQRLAMLDLDAAAEILGLGRAARWWFRGTCATVAGDHSEALDAFTALDSDRPGCARVINQIGVSLYRLERFEEAADAFSRNLAAATASIDGDGEFLARANLVETLRRLGRAEEAHGHWLVLHRIPLRSPGTPAELLDLTPFFNASLDRDPIHPGSGNSLAALPAGIGQFAGVEFDVRGLVVLNSRRLAEPTRARYPSSVSIPVGRRCQAIHFLHGALHARDVPGTTIGAYTIRFEDGTTEECLLRIGENIRDWWARPDDESSPELPGAFLAWEGRNRHIGDRDISLVLHRFTWQNPRDGDLVASITFESAMEDGAPFLVGMSLEPPAAQ